MQSVDGAFMLDRQLIQADDRLDKVSAFWPQDSERVTVGRRELTRPKGSDRRAR